MKRDQPNILFITKNKYANRLNAQFSPERVYQAHEVEADNMKPFVSLDLVRKLLGETRPDRDWGNDQELLSTLNEVLGGGQ